jgi:hypothetical protein
LAALDLERQMAGEILHRARSRRLTRAGGRGHGDPPGNSVRIIVVVHCRDGRLFLPADETLFHGAGLARCNHE